MRKLDIASDEFAEEVLVAMGKIRPTDDDFFMTPKDKVKLNHMKTNWLNDTLNLADAIYQVIKEHGVVL